MNQDTRARLKELIEARDNVRRQIEEQEFSRPIYGCRDRDVQIGGVMAELKETLRQLEECIADLQPSNSGPPGRTP